MLLIMPTIIAPPPPSVFPGGRGDQLTALDYMTHSQRSSLTEGARRIASMIPVIPTEMKKAGVYTQLGTKGQSPGYILFNPKSSRPKSEIVFHEFMHSFDAMSSRKPSNSIPVLPYNIERGVQQQYYGRVPTVRPRKNIVGGRYVALSKNEKYATLAQRGLYGIPAPARKYFSDVFKSSASGRTYKQSGR